MTQALHVPSMVALTGLGGRMNPIWVQFFTELTQLLNQGFTGTVVTAKLTGGGTNGSITFVNGVVTAEVAAT